MTESGSGSRRKLWTMYGNKKIGVVVPAYNEERFIVGVIRSMPDFVDRVYVVNDSSTDGTAAIAAAEAARSNRVTVVNRRVRGGVGAAVLTGHFRALKEDMDVSAVMAGDGQMDPAYLEPIILPVVQGRADYVKGNRLANKEDRREMPLLRMFGNFVMTALTRIASGYWHISDPQNGYTAISVPTLRTLDLCRIELGYAFENDMLVKLNVAGARVVEVRHPALYRGQKSKVRYLHFVLRTGWILARDYVWRLRRKYLRRVPALVPPAMPVTSSPVWEEVA